MNERTGNKIELLMPSEALNRFVPTEQFGALWLAQETEQARYGFRIGNLGLITDAAKGSEVINEYALCVIPNTPAWFSGMINLRGNMVPVFDLNKYFGNEEKKQDRQRILVIGKGVEAAGVLISGFPQVLRAMEELSELPFIPEVLRKHVHKVFTQDDNIWMDFNFEDFFMDLGKLITA